MGTDLVWVTKSKPTPIPALGIGRGRVRVFQAEPSPYSQKNPILGEGKGSPPKRVRILDKPQGKGKTLGYRAEMSQMLRRCLISKRKAASSQKKQ